MQNEAGQFNETAAIIDAPSPKKSNGKSVLTNGNCINNYKGGSADSDGILLRFEVLDTGKGMTQESLKLLFSEYRQVDLISNRKIEGTGLGLSISKALVEMMGGGIFADSNKGKGTVFTAFVRQGVRSAEPIGKEIAESLAEFNYSHQRADREEFEYLHLPGARVLIVDDIDINLEVAAGIMEPYGMAVDCADSGEEAVRLVAEGAAGGKQYDIIFMDHMMPGMDGIQATAAIRGIGGDYASRVPIIALTANAVVGNEKFFEDSGFQSFLPKPISPSKLNEILRVWLSSIDRSACV